MDRVVGWDSVLQRFVVIPTDLILRSKYLWGWLWLSSGEFFIRQDFFTLNSVILTNMSLTSEKSWNLNLVDRFLKCGTTANRDCTNKF
ncbi:hypothetical protein [Leptospira noguchii]|uniref:hypothetical protein n=1 Tax=Leptospira noguchii TaxID=28182 RepID=UPI001FB732EB|nr:hypothetical protein [Leptospira noguchii]UOG53275.1 hypothetical protein MAL09_03550 [Leptospira noguchii]